MEKNLKIKSLSQDELVMMNGGQMTKDTSFAHDFFYVVGYTFRSFYEFVTTAASYQSSLPPNLKK